MLKIYYCDSFTNTLFYGNPAAVVLLEKDLTNQQMQQIASENNLSETAFIKTIGEDTFNIYWFSPLTEIAFCGHATLAAAFVLFKDDCSLTNIHFITRTVGELSVKKKERGLLEMNFPNQCPTIIDSIPTELLEGLSIAPKTVLRNRQAYFAIYSSEEAVRALEINEEFLRKLAPFDVVATSKGVDYDFVSRYFWPANGGTEDPVTGSIHSGLTPYWAEQLNKTQLTAYQASKRGGVLYCSMAGARVLVAGNVVLYMQGRLHVFD